MILSEKEVVERTYALMCVVEEEARKNDPGDTDIDGAMLDILEGALSGHLASSRSKEIANAPLAQCSDS